jgi:hypothetical protein
MGTPATQTLSLTAIVFPARGPSCAPRISARQYQAPSRLSSGRGRKPGDRGYFTGGASAVSWSMRA